jgi:hypothetical protein
MNCKFKFTWRAKADSIQQAFDYKYEITPNTVVHDGKLISKDRNIYFELKSPQEYREKQEKARQQDTRETDTTVTSYGTQLRFVIIPLPSMDRNYLVSKDLDILGYSQNKNESVVNILLNGVEEGHFGIEYSPFDMGVMARNEYSSPHRYLQGCIQGKFSGKYEGTQEINGQQLEIVTFSTKDSNNHPAMKFGFDPKQGFLATYIIDYDNETHIPIYEAFITETKLCSGGRYFPMRSVVVWRENDRYRVNDGKYKVDSFEVTELDVDTPPDSNLLQIELPKGTRVVAQSGENQWMNTDKTIIVTPQKIKKLQKQCVAYGKAYLKKRQISSLFNFTEINLLRGMWIKRTFIVVGLILIVIAIVRRMMNK